MLLFSSLSEIGKLAVGPKPWRLVANLVKVKEPGFKRWQALLIVLGVNQDEAGSHSGTRRQICLLENLKILDIEIFL